MAWPGTLSPGLPGNVAYLDDRVEEDQGDDQPEHELRLADVSDGSSVLTVPPGNHWYFTHGYNYKVDKSHHEVSLFKSFHLVLQESLGSSGEVGVRIHRGLLTACALHFVHCNK